MGQGDEVPAIPTDMTNGEIIEAPLALARVIITHLNKGWEPSVNVLKEYHDR